MDKNLQKKVPSNLLQSYAASASAFEAQAKLYEDERKKGKKYLKDTTINALYSSAKSHRKLEHASSHLHISRTEKLIFGPTSHHSPRSKLGRTGTGAKLGGMEMEQSIEEMWAKIRNESLFYLPIRNPANWMLTRPNKNNNALVLHRSGNGGVREMCSKLSDTDVVYGAFRILVNDQVCHFALDFTGPNTSEKLKSGLFRRAAAPIFSTESRGTIAIHGPKPFGIEFESRIMSRIVEICGLQSIREIKV